MSEAQARRAALLAVDRVYPAAQSATVTAVTRVAPGLRTRGVTDRSLQVELHLAPFAVSQRTTASLMQGRLLLGMADSRMTVWSVQH